MHDRSYRLWMILPILPLVAGFIGLQVISDGRMTLLSSQVAADALHVAGRDLRFFNALSVYLAVGLFHLAGCVAVIVVALLRIAALPQASRARGWQVLAVSIAVLVAVNILARHPILMDALTLSYRTTCDLLVTARVATHIMPPACDAPGLSAFAWISVVPYLAGLTAAAAASALASTAFHSAEADGMAGAERVEQAFHATAFVLVTSTLAMVLFYRLPLPLIADTELLALVTGFGHSMGLFWGVMFTLTLVAIFGPATLMLPRRLPPTPEAAALRDRVLGVGARKRLADILTVLAPLLIGSAGSVLELLAGAI